jgi:hypothetical protein
MPARSKKGRDNGNAQQHEGSLPGGDKPVIVERGKKFAAYDKFGKLIILGYNRRIVQEYADAQSKIRFERQRKD